MTPPIPCKDRFCFLCAYQHNNRGVPVSRPSVRAKIHLVWGERTDALLSLKNAPSQLCSTCNVRLGTDPKKYMEDWVGQGTKTRNSCVPPAPGEQGSAPIDWAFLPYCDGSRDNDNCFFCSHMGAKNMNKKRKRPGRPKNTTPGSKAEGLATLPSSSSQSQTIPVVLMINKDVIGQEDNDNGASPLNFSQLSAVEKHAILVGASEQENLSAQVSTSCASAFRKQQRQNKGDELTMPKIRGKPVTYQQVYSKQPKPRMEISMDLLNRIQTTATLSNKGLERIRALLHAELGGVASFPSKVEFKMARAAMKTDWKTLEIEGGIVAMSKDPAPYLLCIGDVPEKREPMAKICSELGNVFSDYRTILSGDLKWIQVILGLTITGCPYCVSSGRSESHRIVYDRCEDCDLRSTKKAKELAAENKGRLKNHVKGQRFSPLYEFEGSPFLAVACPVLHLGMNLI
ncbi:hypothetical protein FOZ62_004752 [Perkinsus olseni]|uniref:Uncharacterized protein n=1 Tax=Perkinsus olseni TaxID=32597 RepID=A0A7J6SUV6_PEROL|nr:hypothetical protein FOZ62_004752 [Perkinsus olseni]